MRTLSDLDGSNEFLRFIYSLQTKYYSKNHQFIILSGSYFDKIRLLNTLKLTDFKAETELLMLFQTLYTIPTLGSVQKSFYFFRKDKRDFDSWFDYLKKVEGVWFPNLWSSFISSQIHSTGYTLTVPQYLLDNVNALYYHPEINNKDSVRDPFYVSFLKTLSKEEIKYFLNYLRSIRRKSGSYGLALVDCAAIYKNVSEMISNVLEVLEGEGIIQENEEV
jgi:hypothetical protein